MFSRDRALNLLVVTGLLFLMTGTRILCDVGSSMPVDQCCSAKEHIGHEKTSIHDIEGEQGYYHHDDAAPEKAPADSKPNHCCSNWYIFTTESANSALTESTISPILPALTGLPIVSQPRLNNPSHNIANPLVSKANYRAPSNPLYLSIHSYRV